MDPTTQHDKADTSDQAVSEFLLRACHDLRAALRAMRAHSGLMQRNPAAADEGLTQSLGFVVGGAKKLDELIGAMASFAIALRTEPASFLPVKMDAMVRSVLRKLDGELRECNAE